MENNENKGLNIDNLVNGLNNADLSNNNQIPNANVYPNSVDSVVNNVTNIVDPIQNATPTNQPNLANELNLFGNNISVSGDGQNGSGIVTPQPSINSMNGPIASQPEVNLMNEPIAPQPEVNSMNGPIAPQSAVNSMNGPIAPQSAVNSMNEPIAPQPEVNSMNEPIAPQPEVNSMNEPIIPQPEVNQMDQPITLQPDMNIASQPNTTMNMTGQPSLNSDLNNPLVDNFTQVPEPPAFTESEQKPKEKKKSNKLAVIILIVALIASIGYGIYYFLTTVKSASSSASITPKELKLELGSELSEDISDYATVSGYNINDCTVDTSSINTNKVSAYKFYVTCGTNRAEGSAFVDDTTPPSVTLNDVVVVPNSTVTPGDFIASCDDISSCTYEFADESEVLANLQNVGEYIITIIVEDEYSNLDEVDAKLTVSLNAPASYINCQGPVTNVDAIYGTSQNVYKFGIDSSRNFYNAQKTVVFTFETEEDYEEVKNNYTASTGVNGEIGDATFNDNTYTIMIKTNKTQEEVSQDLGTTLPNDDFSIQTFLTFYGYTCN